MVAETAEGIRIFDQHALHERKLFDELLARFAAAEGEDQLLLVPFVADLGRPTASSSSRTPPRSGASVSRSRRSARSRSRFGRFRWPSGTPRPSGSSTRVLETLRDAGRARQRDVIEDVVAHLACRAAVKFSDALPEAEVRALLAYEQSHPEARNCPHGRNTSLLLSLRELETRFQRKK